MTVYAVTYKEGISQYITPGKRYKVMEERHPCFDIEFDNGTRQTGRWDKCAHLGLSEGWIRIDTNSEPVTLRPGDYVSTEGMTEETYHAVARAFANAGCPRFGGDAAGKGQGDYLEWFYDELASTDFAEPGARHLTISQVLNATNAGNKEEEMTPCEKLGYKVGDVFEYTGDGVFPRGGRIRLSEDDGTRYPVFHGIDCEANDGGDWSYADVEAVKRIDGTADHLTTTLQSAREEADKASEHEAQADQHRAKYDELMQQAREMLPDGWRLVRDEEPDSDMGDPANWRVGDVVECLVNVEDEFTRGRGYVLREGCTGQWSSIAEDDVGDQNGMRAEHFRFHHRPT